MDGYRVGTVICLILSSIILKTCSEEVEVLLCYIPDSLNGEIVIRDGGYSQVPHAVLPGTRIALHCNPGFGAFLTSAICLDDGRWSDTIGTCLRKQTIEVTERIGCPSPFVNNGEVITRTRRVQVHNANTFLPGAKVVVTCQPGYQVRNGASESICLGDGNWTETVGVCEPYMLPDNSDAMRNMGAGDQSPSAAQSIEQPMDSGIKEQPPPLPPQQQQQQQQQLACEEAPSLPNGVISIGTSEIGAQRKMMCFSGFTLIGVDTIVCSESGKWLFSGYCAKDCGPTPPIPYGFVLSGPFGRGAVRKIECAQGYILTGVDTITCHEDGQWTMPGICAGKKMFVIPGAFNFDEAIAACEKSGGKMATVKTCADDAAIRALMLGSNGSSGRIRNAWIGLRRAAHGFDRWRWVSDGSFLGSFKGWWPGYPDNKSEQDDCVIYQSWEDFAVGWNDIPCSARTWISSAVRIPFISQNIGVICEKVTY